MSPVAQRKCQANQITKKTETEKMDAKHALHDKQKLWEKRLTAISTAAKSKRKSRANQSTTKTKAEKTDARQRMITLRDKRRLQENALCLRRFLPQDTLDAIDTRVTDFEYEIISSKKKGEWRKIWEDPAFESMLSNKLCKALAVLKACKALVLLGRGNSCRATSCGHKNDKEDSASFLLGSDLPDFGGHFRFHQ